ncbi:MAG: hypothetical protein PWQ77_1521 [Kosmotogales bacterium]|nr:hypothetical protein [Kosmotogales bacterium]
MKKCVIVPTYWGSIDGKEEIVFDHPTDLNSEGTLKRLLKNLSSFEEIKNREISVKIVGISNRNDTNKKVECILEEQIKSFEDRIDISLYSYSQLESFRKEIYPDLFELINPMSYSQIRNLCLYVALKNKVDIGIFLDDDEILIDNDYFKIAEEGMFENTADNGTILGKAGWYDQEKSDFEKFWELKWWPKDEKMNETFDRLMDKKSRFKPTLMGLGGNMVISKVLMKNVCFDPKVNRGEDIDYVLNARFKGYRFYFDPELRIRHLPPDKETPLWRKTREDVYRFLYMRDKFESHFSVDEFQKVSVKELEPYPGIFLKEDLEERIFQHNRALSLKYLSENDKRGFEECMKSSEIPFYYIKNENAANDYLSVIKKWERLTENF